MGVLGLTTFVDDHPALLTDHRLHNTRVLIDGNNLYYFLYYRYFDINICYGGDYNCYADSVRYYFRALKACNISPYVIFDGGYDVEERKLKTTIKRQHSRLKNVTALARGQKGQVFPLLANEVFRQVLNEMDVAHMTCDFEADDQLAALARSWQCPVMSNDSDFFIYDLPKGFIIFDYLDLQIRKCPPGEDPSFPEGYSYLNVQLYHIESLLKSYKGLRRELLPIFATLTGNDFVEPGEFENFFARVKIPLVNYKGPKSKAQSRVQQREQRMNGILKWLAEQENLNHAINTIIACFPEGKRPKAEAILKESVGSYNEVSSHLATYFDDAACRFKNRSKLKTFGGNPVPYWIVSGLRTGEIPTFIINTLTLHRNVLLPQVEMVTEPCAFTCSRPLRVVIYSILLTLDAKLNDGSAGKKPKKKQLAKETVIQEYHRSMNDLTCDRVDLVDRLPGGSPIPYLQSIPHMTTAEREGILWESVGVEKGAFTNLPQSLHLVLGAICYWALHANSKISVNYVYAIAACVVRMMALSESASVHSDSKTSVKPTDLQQQDTSEATKITKDILESQPNELSEEDKELDNARQEKVVSYTISSQDSLLDLSDSLRQETSVEERELVTKNTARFTVAVHHTCDNKFHTIVTHNFSQFQTCLQALMHLNMLLMQPLCNPHPALVYNGTFLYNLGIELDRRAHPKTYICELLGVKSALSRLYLQIVDTILTVVPEDSFLDSNRSKKKSKKKKKSKNKSQTAESSISSDESQSDRTPDETLAANCSLVNRFAGLLIDNE